jgi:glycosyltransferase involved in cell wall biosynthesis
MKPIRVLCLDIEGGFGGSSRSLYESLRHLDRSRVSLEVWCRRNGPIQARYEAIGIPCHVFNDMPSIVSIARLSRNLVDFFKLFWRWPSSRKFRNRLVDASSRFDVIHFNHEGLFLLMRYLRRRIPNCAAVMHIRTYLPENVFSRWQFRVAVKSADRLAFITENERDWVRRYSGLEPAGAVIYNIASPPADLTPAPSVPRDRRLKVAMLSNFAVIRGTDRVVEVAERLAARGRRDIVFVVAGDMALRGSLPGELGRIARAGGSLADYAAARGVADSFVFLGHVPNPESVLQACDLLLKPTREDNPWGRDILEAMAMGRPVISIGRYERFVETGKTGFLLPYYAPDAIADLLLSLDADRAHCRKLGQAAAARIAELCDGPSRARDLFNLWQDAVRARQGIAAP